MKLIDRYNDFYNLEMSGLTHGMPISMEHLQAISIECMIKAFQRKYPAYMREGKIPIDEMLELVEEIYKQGNQTVSEVTHQHRRKDLDAL